MVAIVPLSQYLNGGRGVVGFALGVDFIFDDLRDVFAHLHRGG